MADIDTLRPAFFEECEDLLARMAEGLARIPEAAGRQDLDPVHDVFRAVHSIKGGAGAFGLASLVNFAHAFETVLDLMRAGSLPADGAAMHTLLRASDVLSDMVAAARDGQDDPAQMAALLLELDLLADGGPGDTVEPDFGFQPVKLDLLAFDLPEPDAQPDGAGFAVTLIPTAGLYATGHEPLSLLRALADLGAAEVTADLSGVAPLAALDLARPGLCWRTRITTPEAEDQIAAIFDFVGDLADVTITRLAHADEAPESTPPVPQLTLVPAPKPEPRTARPSAEAAPHAAPATIRVNLDRVDRLINQIGELVIMEAMLSQAISSAGLRDDSDITGSLEGIKQLAANIQESVMSIRAQPLKSVFQRMERITREAADATGKQVRLVTAGEMTEVDKTVIERLVDPLTHMIRNSVDHGIEATGNRLAAGKPAEGVITLSAAHRSGRVIIEVVDDGAGINRSRVREIAEERGLIAPGAQLSPAEIDNLLFMPGFSSKEEVSALSGRGVGLDVVRREIQSLGGRVSIQSSPGLGTSFTIALPLTLAVLEGMLIGVGRETMVLPISSIIETLGLGNLQIHRLGRSGRVIANRGEMIPIIDLAECFGFEAGQDDERGVLILVECDSGRRAALAADRIFDQRQVVIKSLEDNYGAVPGISAATILGDGRIALIVDPEELVERAAKEAPSLSLAANG
ncbi:chemotaxis protein CheA [Paracoccus sp. (in: a-proteobacteria)]|uniref:chemotaxis protein CheA n=1 Tax=Paracoccus sp. TaxID=267 RepID=UPI00272B6B83|nr:chemotaxis protein CheA [Paracoccus sp. (in: a-proteobacteria)]